MATYRYNAIDETGNALSGTLDAESIQNANAILGARGLIPTEIREDKEGGGESLMDKINAIDRWCENQGPESFYQAVPLNAKCGCSHYQGIAGSGNPRQKVMF